MDVVVNNNSKIDENKILHRLSGRSIGMTARELARSLKVRPSEINQCLLQLQSKGQVKFRGSKWVAAHSRGDLGSNVATSLPGGVNSHAPRIPEMQSRKAEQSEGEKVAGVRPPEEPGVLSPRIDRRASRWSEFRRLCDYYAECVRLDQRSSITAKATDEFETIVCIDGALPNATQLRIRTRDSWHKWVRKLTADEYLFVGYPLQRYRWRDTQKGEDVDFVSPVFVLPCRTKLNGTDLELESVGPVRINEGWLERRLKNIDERRTFLELCGVDTASDEGISSTSWSECARLLNHFYPDWNVETLDPGRIQSIPCLADLQQDGIYNRAALVIPKKWKFTGGLYKELLKLANDTSDDQLDGSALRLFFPHVGPDSRLPLPEQIGLPEARSNVVGSQVLTLNHEQMAASQAAAEKDLSIVVGPPGTGKSRVVAAVLAQQALLDRSGLAASRNHQALEAVVPRVNAITEPWPIMLRLARPWGAPADMSMQAAIGQLVSSDLVGDRRHLESMRQALSKRIVDHAEAARVVSQIGELRESLRKRTFDLGELTRLVPEKYREASANYDSRIPSAVDLDDAYELLEVSVPFRWSLAWFWQRLTKRNRLRRGLTRAMEIDSCLKQVFDQSGSLPAMENKVTPETVVFSRQVLSFWKPMILANEAARLVQEMRGQLESLPPTDEACRSEHEAAKEVQELSAACFLELARQSGAEITDEERGLLANILATIENRSGLDTEADHRRWSEAMRKAFPIFLKHFPLAATTNLSIRRDINLEPGVFDLLVIDEASQCDIASVIPLVFRAKRAMIVGDPMQLSHVTSLSAATDRHLRRQFGVDAIELERYSYRSSSMFHLANTSPGVGSRVSLRQHHRCHPSVAAYCSETFYKGTWTVLTEDTGSQGIQWTHVADDSEPAPGGGALSKDQIRGICTELERLRKDGYVGSVGVVTPFRQQANRLRDAIHQALPHDFILKSRLLVDTADGFQGDERDVVLFSLVGGENLTDGSLRFLSGGPNRFNVAVSRAKQLLHIFGDIAWARNCDIRHIRILAEFCDREQVERKEATAAGFRKDLVGPVWEPALAEAMTKAGLKFSQQYPACGRWLDFALFNNEMKLDVEVDGETYHRSGSGDRIADDIRRDQALIANGWTILRFWVYELREDMDGCVRRIDRAINGIVNR